MPDLLFCCLIENNINFYARIKFYAMTLRKHKHIFSPVLPWWLSVHFKVQIHLFISHFAFQVNLK